MKNLKQKYNLKDYEKNLKDHCVSCGKEMKNNLTHYEFHGNYCIDCSAKCENICKLRVAIKKPDKNKKKIVELLKNLKKWGIGMEYIVQIGTEIGNIKKELTS